MTFEFWGYLKDAISIEFKNNMTIVTIDEDCGVFFRIEEFFTQPLVEKNSELEYNIETLESQNIEIYKDFTDILNSYIKKDIDLYQLSELRSMYRKEGNNLEDDKDEELFCDWVHSRYEKISDK